MEEGEREDDLRPMEITLTGYDSGLEAWVSKRRELMQRALLPSLSLYGSLCIENHNLFFSQGLWQKWFLRGNSTRKTAGALHTAAVSEFPEQSPPADL